MKLFEYQAKDLFAEYGIAVPRGKIIENPSEAGKAVEELGGKCVLKSQVLTGGRGKAGLIQFADSIEQAQAKAKQLFQSGRNVKKILAEEFLEIDKELYLSITIEPVEAKIMIMASSQGGVDIEDLAVSSPEKIVKEKIEGSEIFPFQVRNILFKLGVKDGCFKQCFKIINRLFEVSVKRDVELAEINPLVITKNGAVVAADGKIILDDSASFRQKNFTLTREHFDSDIEFEATQKGFPYIQFDGAIGLMCAGAGLTNTVYDLINYYNGTVANYLEFGGPNYKRGVEAMELTLRNKPKVILIVTFGTIARADVMAESIAEAKEKLKPNIPIITAIRGTGEEKAQEILRSIGLEPLLDTEEAVKRAVELTGRGVK